jgi:hypothetical protein
MSRIQACIPLVALLAIAGCAGAPEVADEPPAAVPVAVAAAEEGDDAAPNAIKVVDANELIAREPEPVLCRDMLMPNSNVHTTRCMTAENWKRWQRREAQNAAATVRMMQGRDRF